MVVRLTASARACKERVQSCCSKASSLRSILSNIAHPQRIIFSFHSILKVKYRQFILCGLNATAQNDKFKAKKPGYCPVLEGISLFGGIR
ncbi:hypothetical protein DWG95_02355 [Escherichia coli]|nr:hypothetical protein [Escherichia coli]